jgi:hypothetical protein
MASEKECTVGTHAKKVAVESDHAYVNAGKGTGTAFLAFWIHMFQLRTWVLI